MTSVRQKEGVVAGTGACGPAAFDVHPEGTRGITTTGFSFGIGGICFGFLTVHVTTATSLAGGGGSTSGSGVKCALEESWATAGLSPVSHILSF